MSLVTLPNEIIEHILSLCSAKDLLRLIRTCKKLKNFVTSSKKLMAKLRLVINFDRFDDEPPVDDNLIFMEIKDCLKNRNFSVMKVKHLENNQMTRIFYLQTLANWGWFENIVELKVESCYLTLSQFKKLIQIFMPGVKALHLEDIRRNGPFVSLQRAFATYQSSLQNRFMHLPTLKSIQELSLDGCCSEFHAILSKCDNLKRLKLSHTYSIGLEFKSFFINQETFNFKLEELEIVTWMVEANFSEFLKRQTSLEKMTCALLEIPNDVYEAMLQLPTLREIKISKNLPDSLIDMSDVPHHELKRFKFWNGDEVILRQETTFSWVYQPKAPGNRAAFEHDVLAFLESKSAHKHLQHCKIIDSIIIGKESWVNEGFALSQDFIRKLILKTPKLTSLQLYNSENLMQIIAHIFGPGRQIAKIDIFGLDGHQVFQFPSPQDDENLEMLRILF